MSGGLNTVRRRPTAAPSLPRAAWVSMILDTALALTGLAGGAYMALHPLTMMPLRFLEGSPFDSWLVPGIALAALNGVWPIGAMLLTWHQHRLAALAQCGVGLTLLGWLLIQIPLVGYATMFQVPYSALAFGLITLNAKHVVVAGIGPPQPDEREAG